MARIRSVHPDICKSETMAKLSAELERTFVRLWTNCDDEGRCEDRPRLLKAALYPEHDDMTVERVNREINQLAQSGLVIRYEAEGHRYLAIKSWHEYQHPQRARESTIPPPPSMNGTRQVREPSRTGEGIGIGSGNGNGNGLGASARRVRAVALPKNWVPSKDLIEWARGLDDLERIDLIAETAKFHDHFDANGKALKDWNAAWRNWVRRAIEYKAVRA